ncbi:SUMF1/EgtB/PvdO family nonheme iron enzyme [Tellurirhabdus bombi]|uniref:SUMF1/EgtB/PvdO family nonheme iron enzyme n=1 Tax=Tellurirhabdus bombi TaxID=2907205 RepID=UPI001F3B035F|nr:SUMF1/EgtB/PvdO family nonheme iron enzyme [Tellurirhabdus bombi]
MNRKQPLRSIAVLLAFTVAFAACKSKHPTSVKPGKESTATGIAYNQKDGFQVAKYKGQSAGPNLVFVEGGRFTMGALEEDVMNSRDNRERTVSIQSFYMDETEIANLHYLEYLNAIQKDSSEEVYTRALPDTNVWTHPLSYNDPYVTQYLRFPGFRYYPVVGVSWVQANDYSIWRTNAVNANLAGKSNSSKKGFSLKRKKKGEVDGAEQAPAEQEVKNSQSNYALESGTILPNYRLPSEAEWEYAAKALIGTQYLDENQSNQRIYPWDGSSVRNAQRGRKQGQMLANFKRGRGDYAGIAGKSNDGAIITQEIYEYPPNDFGLYNMAGNVNEWVYDVYRPLSYQDVNDLNPLRRNGYLDEEKNYDSKNSNSLINDKVRVYKGGSWSDVSYWLSPGTRRFMDQDSATATIGFRCAMIAGGRNK